MKQVRTTRRLGRLLLAVAVVGVVAGLTAVPAPPAGAMTGPEPDAAGTNITHPVTGAVVDEWKWVGYYDYPGISAIASGVQIAPQWILTSQHSAPWANGTDTFRNRYGSARIDGKHPLPGFEGTGWNDVVLAHLATPIVAPRYPRLLDGDLTDDLAAQQQGVMLGTGWSGGRQHAGFTTPNGTISLAMEAPLENDGGDSGGGIFWYSPRTPGGVLTGLNARKDGPDLAGASLAHRCVGTAPGRTCTNAPVNTTRAFLDGVVGAGVLNWVPVSSLTTARVPAAPLLTARSSTADSISFTVAPPNPGDGTITGYRVRVAPAGIDLTTTDPRITLRNLPVGVAQKIVVAAVSTVGTGATTVATAKPLGVAVTDLQVTPDAEGVTAQMTFPSAAIGLTYRLRVLDGAGAEVRSSTGTSITATTATSGFSLGLRRNTAYTAEVAVEGDGWPSAPATRAFRTLDIPVSPTNLRTTPMSGAVRVDWTPAADHRGATAPADHLLEIPGFGDWTVPGTATSHTFAGMPTDPPITHNISLRARNAAGQSEPARTVGGGTLARVAPPKSLRAFSLNGGLEVAWTNDAVTSEPATTYTATVKETGATVTTTQHRATFTGLTNGRTYSITVKADNGTGNTITTSVSGVPGPAPVGLASLSNTTEAGGTRYSWTRPAGLNGVVDYIIDRADGSSERTTATNWLRPTAADAEVIGVSVAQTGPLGQIVSNASMSGPSSRPAPTNVRATGPVNGMLAVAWNSPASVPANGYRVEVFGPTGVTTVDVPAGSTTVAVSSAAFAGRRVTVSVKARHATGASLPTRTTHLATAAPTNVQQAGVQPLTRTSLRVRWEAPLNDGGQTVSYRVTSPQLPTTYTATSTYLDLTGLTARSDLELNIVAVNASGTSASVRTFATVGGPSAVQRPAAFGRAGGADVSWTPARWTIENRSLPYTYWAAWADTGAASLTTWCNGEEGPSCPADLATEESVSIGDLAPGRYVIGLRPIDSTFSLGGTRYLRVTVS